jgi:hypothetical protein
MTKHIDIGHLEVGYGASKMERKIAYSRKLFAVLAELATLDGDTEEAKALQEMSNANKFYYTFTIEAETE